MDQKVSSTGLEKAPQADGIDPVCHRCGAPLMSRLHTMHGQQHVCEPCLLELPHLAPQTASETAMYGRFTEALAQALDLREHETGLHSKRVACHTQVLARRITDDPAWLHQVYWGALLHDIGKIGVPDHILLKQGSLTPSEWSVMRCHAEDGYRLVTTLPGLQQAAEVVYAHEERFDGSGYPRALKGKAIPLGARLFAVIDTLDAITSDRPYRKAVSFDEAKLEILRMAGTQFDPSAVEVFLSEEAALREMVSLKFDGRPEMPP